MKTDTPGCLDVKLAIIAKDPAPWLEALTSLGTVDHEEEVTGWAHRRVRIGFVGADRVISDGNTEIPDVSIAEVPRVAGPPSKETLQGALKDVLREAAKAPG